MIITLVLLLIIVIVIGIVGTDGLWHSVITFFNVLLAATLATNFFEPASLWLDAQIPTFTFIVDILVLWGLFALFALIFRLLTSALSKVRVKFLKPVDLIGGMLVSAWTGWILVCFTLMSLHVAPLPLSGFGSAFQPEPESRMFFSLAPDRKWLSLTQKMSRGGFARSAPLDEPDKYVFDPQSRFILTYGARREILESLPELRVRREWGSGTLHDPSLTGE
jgi:hypothetical protein